MDMDMNYSQKIRNCINELPAGGLVTVKMFPSSWPRETVLRSLSRFCKEGIIKRVKSGVYSKTKATRFGNVVATSLEVLAKEVHEDANKCFGGLFLFNNLGLTTQVPTIIEVLNNKSSYKIHVGSTLVKYIRIRPKITKESKKHIMFLEVLKNSKSIPDADATYTYRWICKKIAELDEKELKKLVSISLEYPPRVRAILGNLLITKWTSYADKLKTTLKTTSLYKVGRIVDLLKDPEEWKLKN
jgi:hypothetical protein